MVHVQKLVVGYTYLILGWKVQKLARPLPTKFRTLKNFTEELSKRIEHPDEARMAVLNLMSLGDPETNKNRPPPHILRIPGLKGVIGRCSKPFEKQLTERDVKVNQSRLVMSKYYVKNHLMPLFLSGENPRDGIPVRVMIFTVRNLETRKLCFVIISSRQLEGQQQIDDSN
ncbi:hypothetical protein ACFE04_012576 [Oxalis oulophora]